MISRWKRVLALAGGMAVAAAVSISDPPTAAAAPAISFGNPTISGVQGTGFEQGLRIDSEGRLYSDAPGSLSSTITYINRSFDGGATWKWVAGAVQPFGKPTTCVGGGDGELATDSAGHLYFADLTLANLSTARSGDRGRTFAASCTGVPITPVDRPWLAADGDPTQGGSITATFDWVPDLVGTGLCQLNNRVVFSRSPIPVPGTTTIDSSTAGVQYGPVQIVNSDPCNEGIMGNDEIFDYGGATRVFVVHDNSALNRILVGRCDLVDFSVSPTGYGNCQDVDVTDFPGYKTGANFPTMTIDRAGNIFVVWEQAKVNVDGTVSGDTLVYYSVSTTQGDTWSTPRQLPTGNLHSNVFAWAAAGDAGRVDVAWYGTSATSLGPNGPDSVSGDWSLYLEQSLNFTSATPSWSGPVLASEHFVHRGSMFTLIGGQTGDRTEGDFLQLRIGPLGEANIAYADSNSSDEFDAQAAFVRQNGGPSLYASIGTVNLPARRYNSVQVGAHSATFDSAGVSSSQQPNLEMLGSQMRLVNSGQTLEIKMLVADLRSLAAKGDSGGTTLVWDTQWKVPSISDRKGGKYFHAYMQSVGGAAPTFSVGQTAVEQEGGGLLATYPGLPVPGLTGSYTATAPGVITIDVPTSAVTETAPLDNLLYSVTSASMSLVGTADGMNTCQTTLIGGKLLNSCIGGVPFNLIDTTPAYDFNPSLATHAFVTCHEHDGGGTITGKHGGTASFRSDEDSCDDGLPNGESFSDSGAGETFTATSVTSIVYDDALGTAAIAGQGVANGNPVTFTIVETAATVLSAAQYAITLSDGYVNSGELLTGLIRLA